MRQILLVAFLLFGGPALAQVPRQSGPPAPPPANNLTTLFRGLFHFHGVQPEVIKNLGRSYDYANLIVVVHGDPDLQTQRVKEVCRATLSAGGAVLLAADTPLDAGGYLPGVAEVRITGGVVSHWDEEVLDNSQRNRPIVLPVPGNVGVSPFTGVSRVATFEPSCLVVGRSPRDLPLRQVAVFPPNATLVQNGRKVDGLAVVTLPFAVATTDERLDAHCMIVADPDVFSNRLIYTSGRADNPTDNLKLANNTVQWLKGANRSRCLFVENGQVRDRFDEFEFAAIPTGPPLPPVPPITPPDLFDPELQQAIAGFVNKEVDKAQTGNAWNRGLLSLVGGRKEILLATLATIVLLVIYALTRTRAVRGWYRKTFRPLPRDPAMLGPDVAVGSLGHRRLELLRTTDYGPVVRPLVRRLFQERGLPAEYAADTLPPLDIAVPRPKFLQDAIRTLWAESRATAPIGYGRWRMLEPLLAAVRAAADDDRWRFVGPTSRDAAT
ncbi:MAG: hypothetical protein MUF18_07405 [Fimbriiglobus sp.]|nr:hypothetical protein [Fimbriiglobus sp.]